MKGRFLFLGTSASMATPVIGCQCEVCLSSSCFNKRLRPASLISIDKKQILLDAGPDFYHQAIKYQINHLDGLILTHTHHDHIGGLDDLRVFSFRLKKPLPILASQESYEDIKKRYDYLVESISFPKFSFQVLESSGGQTCFLDFPVSYVSYHQIGMKVLGYRLGNLAYVTDIKEYDSSLYGLINGCETLVISAIDWHETRAHLGIQQILEIVKIAKPKRVFLTHLGHELDYKLTERQLPSFVRLAYDGLSIEFTI